MDTQMGIGDFIPWHPSARQGETSSGPMRNSPQTRHKPKATRVYTQGFLRVTEEPFFEAKTAPKGHFFP